MHAVLQVVLSNALLAMVPAALALLAARFGRRPALVHALWVLALVKLVTPPIFSLTLPFGEQAASDGAAGMASGGIFSLYHVEIVALCIWSIGVLAAGFRMAGRVRQAARVMRWASPAPRDVVRRVRKVSHRLALGRSPRVLMVPQAMPPMLWGFFTRARLVLPVGLWEKLDDAQRDAMLAHELAHWRRRDHWVRCLEVAVGAIFWWNPLVWLAQRSLRQAEEDCCDAWAVWAMPRNRKAYARALVDTLDHISGDEPSERRRSTRAGERGIAAGAALATAAPAGGDVRRRLVQIMRGSTPRGMSAAGAALLAATAAAMLPVFMNTMSRARAGGSAATAQAAQAPSPERDAPQFEPIPLAAAVKEHPVAAAPTFTRPQAGNAADTGDNAAGASKQMPDSGALAERRHAEAIAAAWDVPLDRKLTGVLVQASETGMTLSIGDEDFRREVLVNIDEQTRFRMDNAGASLSDLEPGMTVRVWQHDGVTAVVEVRKASESGPALGQFGKLVRDASLPDGADEPPGGNGNSGD